MRVPLVLAAFLLAGCVTPSTLAPQSAVPDLKLLPQAASLWPDHENAPHPAFGWPTLTHPAAGASVPAFWKPIPDALPPKITGMKHLAKAEGVQEGAGIALFGSIALVPGEGKPSSVVDISDPAKPTLLSTYKSASERGAAIMAFPDGRLYGVVSTGAGFDVVNITNPKDPSVVAEVKPERHGHKVGVVPGTPIVYNANSKGGDGDPLFGVTGDTAAGAKGETEIYDLTDPERPVLVENFKNGYGCHHIFFWISAEKQRALCAGIEYTQIWDIANPRDPKVIVSIPVHHGNPMLPATSVPPFVFSHFSILNEKGDMLIVGDEFMGGAPAECDGVHTPVKDASGPLGNLWFYDIKDEKSPKLLGWFSPPPHMITNPDPNDGCTAHHGRLVPDPEGKRQLIAMAWYGAGVVLVDFTDPLNAKLVDQWNDGTNVWEAWYYNGYVFTGDLNRGLDVLALK
jgi:hypothetical protein